MKVHRKSIIMSVWTNWCPAVAFSLRDVPTRRSALLSGEHRLVQTHMLLFRFLTAFHLLFTSLMGLKKSFQHTIYVWWLYWFSFPPFSLSLSHFTSLATTFSSPASLSVLTEVTPQLPSAVSPARHFCVLLLATNFQTCKESVGDLFFPLHLSQHIAACKMYFCCLTGKNLCLCTKQRALRGPPNRTKGFMLLHLHVLKLQNHFISPFFC